jgi:hypothetical protein
LSFDAAAFIMHKFILMILAVAGLYLSVPMLAVDTNQAQSSVAVTGHFKTSQPGSNQNRPL